MTTDETTGEVEACIDPNERDRVFVNSDGSTYTIDARSARTPTRMIPTCAARDLGGMVDCSDVPVVGESVWFRGELLTVWSRPSVDRYVELLLSVAQSYTLRGLPVPDPLPLHPLGARTIWVARRKIARQV